MAGFLLYVGRDQLPSATFLSWAMTFGAAMGMGVVVVSFYRVKLELKRSRHELARKDAELNFAREVQRALFPTKLPKDSGLSFAAICIPAQGISGDYYDVLECEDGRTLFALADISGKGISAAILMANLQAVLRTVAKDTSSLTEVCTRLNDHLYQVTEPSKFATFFVGQWIPSSARLEYVNAGHQIPVLVGPNENGTLSQGGPPLGMFPQVVYKCGWVTLKETDLLVVYSDGVTEARSASGLEFGEHRLRELVTAHAGEVVDEIQSRILEALGRWSGRELEDDMTIVIVKVDANPSPQNGQKDGS
jgi:sigma-B regulation protein RsbU (phosphoserine phosphatase)